jgi:hypothetical protein
MLLAIWLFVHSLDDPLHAWFMSQKIPGTNDSCCSQADQVYAEEKIIDGEYWVIFQPKEWKDKDSGLMKVPPKSILSGHNPSGKTVVWYGFNDGKLYIRCFHAGPLT